MKQEKRTLSIISNGPEMIRRSKKYNEKVKRIKSEIRFKYSDFLSREESFIQRLVLRIKMHLEIRRAINELTSIDKLYIRSQY